MLLDALLWIPKKMFELLLDGIAYVIEQIPPPDFMVNNSIGDYIHTDIIWLLSMSGVSDALAVMAASVVFRFLRRVLTLGIW